ncbi:hypothetical protein [Spirosoma foliorum]|uniref:Uncharacterized protein n=1 Tax=Spirosoma foliorum TaxID=2710596 RepID=A0A7G5H2I7_9BACT|nr:hypothetical protein [Spirosoma foliorum]QMW05329.1 hypothetical protein H3H32_10790 [Spirosoma foliorum]
MERIEVELVHPDTAIAFGKAVGETVHIYPHHAKPLLADGRVKEIEAKKKESKPADQRKTKEDKSAGKIDTK